MCEDVELSYAMNRWKKGTGRVIWMQTEAMMITVMIANDNDDIENGRVSRSKCEYLEVNIMR